MTDIIETASASADATPELIAAYRRAAAEVARETCAAAGDILGAAGAIFYAIEAEHRVTGAPPDEIAFGDPFAAEAMDEVIRLGLRTHAMRGWLVRAWPDVVARAEALMQANEVQA